MTLDFIPDASVLIEVFGAVNPDRSLVARVRTGAGAAPEVIDLETVSTLRRHVRRHEISPRAAAGIVELLDTPPLARSPHRPLIARIRELRHSITAYDAAYVAIAERLDVPSVTCDAKLAASNTLSARMELYTPA